MSYIVIDDNLRTMTIPTDIVLLGVESDDDVNKIPFKMPKTYSGYDLSEFEARINYMNAKGEGDVYIVDDLTVDQEDPTIMTFTWIVGRNACKYKGNTKFIVCLKKFEEGSSEVIQEFNTTVYVLPVLEGLETTDAVIQQNSDVIEQILQKIDDSGLFDPNEYYTKDEVDEMIPTELPNPEDLTINGTSYNGSESVDLTIEATTILPTTASGKFIHVVDAVPQNATGLQLYDSSEDPIESANVVVTNKNLIRLDQITGTTTVKGITFTKNDDGSIKANGISSDTNASVSCSLDKNAFIIGQAYTLSTGKILGFASVQLSITYADTTTETIISTNTAVTFTITKAVASVTASIIVLESGVTVSNELVYAQLEVGTWASTFTNNSYESITYDGTNKPMLPDYICNLWSNSDSVANMVLEYEGDTTYTKINNYANENVIPVTVSGRIVAAYDGRGTVSIGVG